MCCCCSNKDTVPTDHLDTLNPEERLTLFTNLGTLLLLAEILLCWLFGQMDPLGEANAFEVLLMAVVCSTSVTAVVHDTSSCPALLTCGDHSPRLLRTAWFRAECTNATS